jgi:protein-S-isoprenylcysteine O-methyltransferase
MVAGTREDSMKPLPFIWPYALVFWVVFLWAYSPEFAIVRKAQKDQTESDSKSLQVIMFGQSIAFLASFVFAWVPALQFALAFRMIAFYLGTALLIVGSLLRRHCFRMLGTSFTGDVRASADQKVVDRGAYRILRHPAYTAGVILNTGVGVALGSWLAAVLMAVASFAVYVYRISVEERKLLTVIGEPYRAFMVTRKRLIPFVY